MARPKGTPKTNRVTVSLDDKTHKVLQDYSSRDDVSISWLIRRAIADMIENRAAPTLKNPITKLGPDRKKA
jgi:Ribbon-helix-helix protein, copG family